MRQQDHEKKTLMEQLRIIPIISVACGKTGVPRSTVYRWINEDKVFAARVQSAMKLGSRNLNDLAYGKLIKKIHEEDSGAIMFYLRARHPQFKKPKMKIEVAHKPIVAPEVPGDIYDQINLGKLPKRLRRRVVKGGMKMRDLIQEVVNNVPDYQGMHIELTRKMLVGTLRGILEED